MTKNIPPKELETLIHAADYDLKVRSDLSKLGNYKELVIIPV